MENTNHTVEDEFRPSESNQQPSLQTSALSTVYTKTLQGVRDIPKTQPKSEFLTKTKRTDASLNEKFSRLNIPLSITSLNSYQKDIVEQL